MRLPVLAATAATPLTSCFPGVSIWVSGITITPIGFTFCVIASMTDPGIRFQPSATIEIGADLAEIGGGTSASRRQSMTTFLCETDLSTIGVDEPLKLSLFEANGPCSERQLLQTFVIEK